MATTRLHKYYPSRPLLLLEHLPGSPTTPPPTPSHVLLFVGGLYDTFLQPQYVTDLAALFPLHADQTWRVFHVQLSSNGRSWGQFSIDRDIEEIAAAITFLRTKLYKNESLDVVIMGHSTGCQDTMRYLTAPNPASDRAVKRPIVQGAILQAPVSDRDGVLNTIQDEQAPEAKKAYDAAIKICDETPEKDRRDVILPMNLVKPLFGPVATSVERFLSLCSPGSPDDPSIEDFFSNDLHDSTLKSTFGKIGKSGLLRRSREDASGVESLLVLMSDSDEHVRPQVSQRKLLERWKGIMAEHTGAVAHGDSAVILNAMHDVGGFDWPSQEARLVVLRKKVLSYLRDVVGDVGRDAEDIWHQDGDRVMRLKAGDGRNVEEMVGVLKL